MNTAKKTLVRMKSNGKLYIGSFYPACEYRGKPVWAVQAIKPNTNPPQPWQRFYHLDENEVEILNGEQA